MFAIRKGVSKFKFLIYVLPVIALISLIIYIPFFMSMAYSFTEWNGISREAKFIGFENFKNIFVSDSSFQSSAVFTLKYAVLFIIIINVLALLLAVMLDKKLYSTNILRAGFFIPYILSLVIVGFIWRFIFMQGFSALEKITGWNVFSWSWLGDVKLAFWSILIVSIWQSIGLYIVIYIGGFNQYRMN